MSRTIIIHPGSSWLRIGRASDAFPLSIPNVIARRSLNYDPIKDKGKGKERAVPIPATSNFIPPISLPLSTPLPVSASKEFNPDVALDQLFSDDDDEQDSRITSDPSIPLDPLTAKINSIRGDLKTRMRIFKVRGQANANKEAKAYNAEVVPEKTADYNDPNEIEWTDVTGSDAKEFYVGMKVCFLLFPVIIPTSLGLC